MLLIHGALDGSHLLVWGEPFADPGSDASRSVGRPDAALDAASLRAALAELGAFDEGEPAALRARFAGHDVDVPAVRLDPRQSLLLLGRVHSHLVAHGMFVDRALVVLARLARHAAAAVVRQELVPGLRRTPLDRWEARWQPLLQPDAREALQRTARDLPAAALLLHDTAAATRDAAPGELASDDARMRAAERLVAALGDELVRARLLEAPVAVDTRPTTSLHDRWLRALLADDPVIEGPFDAVEQLADEVDAWQERLRRRTESPFRLCFRLEEPRDAGDDAAHAGDELGEGATWYLRFLVQSRDDPTLLVDLADAWRPRGTDKDALARLGFHPGEHLFAPLGEAARLSDVVAASLGDGEPAGAECTTAEAHAFLTEAAPLLEQAGFGVFVPAWWRSRGGRFTASLRAHVVTELTGGRRTLDALNLETLVGYDWRLAIGETELTERELRRLADQKVPLLHVRGRWVQLDAAELRAAIRHVDRLLAPRHGGTPDEPRPAHMTPLSDLVAMSVGAAGERDGLPISGVDAEGGIADLLAQLPTHELVDALPAPAGLRAKLRPYQLRGYQWLDAMGRLGLGACLADDMGLGKTVQVLAAVEAARAAGERLPTLVVCPTSVVTNWLRECERFTPDLAVLVHHGTGRDREAADLHARLTSPDAPAVVLTSYALLARDRDALAAVDWARVVLDEAQNIKNPGTGHARAARALRAPVRVALTGTPIENHVGDLWSIMEFLNPGLLGTQRDFRRRYLLPVQSGDFPEVTERLRSLTRPFVLRRLKTDRTIISDLPEKFETVDYCNLTDEQAVLYESIVADAKRVLRGPRMVGIDRRGMLLATIAKLKQACNHPAQLLGDNSRIDGRSGKLARLEALVEQVLDRGERALVFTQFVQMGELLRTQLQATFGREVLFLHGGTSRTQRDRIVERFQDADPAAPPILVLSLKAGGSGLNLTAASHVFHFDRWWNPATEQQASDRAFRIGQTRDVQVHALVCVGTLEERIDRMLVQKRAVAETVVGSGERWITELDDDELLGLIELRRDTLLQPADLGHTGKRWGRATL